MVWEKEESSKLFPTVYRIASRSWGRVLDDSFARIGQKGPPKKLQREFLRAALKSAAYVTPCSASQACAGLEAFRPHTNESTRIET